MGDRFDCFTVALQGEPLLNWFMIPKVRLLDLVGPKRCFFILFTPTTPKEGWKNGWRRFSTPKIAASSWFIIRVPTETLKPVKWKLSWKIHGTLEICKKSWNFVISPRILLILPNLYLFLQTLNKFSIILESLHFPTFSAKCCTSKILTEMAIENRETVMEKSWKPFCKVCGNHVYAFNREPLCLRPPLNKKVFPVHRPGGLKRADWDSFSLIFEKSFFSQSCWYILVNEKKKNSRPPDWLCRQSPGVRLFIPGVDELHPVRFLLIKQIPAFIPGHP